MRPERLCGVLAEPERLRAFAAIALGATTPEAVAERAGLPARSVAAAVLRLLDSGLVRADSSGLVAQTGVFKAAVRPPAPSPKPTPTLDPDAKRDAVLHAYIENGRLVRIPATRTKRRVVLEHLVTAFESGVRYPEPVVNETLHAWHEDHAALRRHLVEESLMSREHGIYWRTV